MFHELSDADFLETPEERAAYLAAAVEYGDPDMLEMAMRRVRRAEELTGGGDGR